MDTSEKVISFDSFEALTQEVMRDRDTKDMLAQRYAVRFIMLNNFGEFKNLAKFMTSIGVSFLDLEDLIDDEENDEWITKDVLLTELKNCRKSTFVTPFSEVVRFYNDDEFRGFFNEIMLLEDIRHPEKRIYIPLIGLQNRFTDFLNHFARIQESAPIWRYEAETQSVEVYFAKYKDFVLPNETIQCQLNSLREWLRFWKVQAPQKRIVCTSKPISAKYQYSKPDNIFNFTKISNAYEFMTQFLDLGFPFKYKEEEKSYWEMVLEKIDKSKISQFSFDGFIRKLFNKVKFEANDILIEWCKVENTSFERWLLSNYALNSSVSTKYPYFALCVESSTDLSDSNQLINMISTRVLYDIPANKRDEYSQERLNLISENKALFEKQLTTETQEWLYERTKEIFQQQSDLLHAINLCTGAFDFEKKLLIGWSNTYPENIKLKEALSRYYPEYVAYHQNVKPSHFTSSSQGWFVDYLAQYKKAKTLDKYLPSIIETLDLYNDSSANFYKWYFNFQSSHDLLAEVKNNVAYSPDKIYWIDGLGSEFLSYILYLIEQENSNLKVVRSQFCRSELPTSTFHNRFEGDNVQKFGELDELGHDPKGYKRFDTLIQELKVLKSIVHEIIETSRGKNCTIAIVSDHGLSCLSRLESSKKYDGKFEHEGRYIKTNETAHSDSDYIVHKNDIDGQIYKVALTHASLSKKPTHQVHGGCTPEEVVVPFLLLSNKNIATHLTKYQISGPLNGDIMLSNPAVTVSIIPEPKGAILKWEGKEYKMDRHGTSWTAMLTGITEGNHIIDIKPEGANSFEMTITVIGVSCSTDIDNMFDL